MSSSSLEQLATELIRRHWTVAVAESVTGGRIQALLTSLSGSSEYFVGGVTAYNCEQKVRLLAVDAQHAAQVNCVSERTCVEMARGAVELFRASIALAITGYAEPDEAWQVRRPLAIVAVCCSQQTAADQAVVAPVTLYADGNRATVQASFAAQAIEHLLRVVQTG